MSSPVLASSLLSPPSPTLRGYAFIGADLIIGDLGRVTYHGAVSPGHDGAYVSVAPDPPGRGTDDADGSDDTQDLVIGTDASGLGRLFLYQDGERWAVGTSLIELAEYVSGCGWPLTLRGTRIRGFLLLRSLGQQLTSERTVLDEIRILLPDEELALTPGGGAPRVRRRTGSASTDDYPSALQAALSEMVGRLRTLLHSGLPVTGDLTGGRDSRTVLAALRLANDTGRPLGHRVSFASLEHLTDDFAVAQGLARRLGLTLNEGSPAHPLMVDPWEGYRHWRRHDLGIYAPIYPFRRSGHGITLSGGGGATHRVHYRSSDMAHHLRSMAPKLLSPGDVELLVTEMRSTLGRAGGHEDERVEHARLFRHRFHDGRQAVRVLQAPPLSSMRMRTASQLLSPDRAERAQFFVDALASLAPDLAFIPFDKPSKGWDRRHLKDLTRVRVNPAPFSGRVYGQPEVQPQPRHEQDRPTDPYRESFAASRADAEATGLLPTSVTAKALTALERAGDRTFAHGSEGIPVALTILTAETSRLATRVV